MWGVKSAGRQGSEGRIGTHGQNSESPPPQDKGNFLSRLFVGNLLSPCPYRRLPVILTEPRHVCVCVCCLLVTLLTLLKRKPKEQPPTFWVPYSDTYHIAVLPMFTSPPEEPSLGLRKTHQGQTTQRPVRLPKNGNQGTILSVGFPTVPNLTSRVDQS